MPGIACPLLAVQDEVPLAREVFGNIPAASKVLFYVLAVAACACFAFGVFRRTQLWRLGRADSNRQPLAAALARLLREVLLRRRVRGRGLASTAHLLIFSGFVVLLVGTTLIAVEHFLAGVLARPPGQPVFRRGIYYAVFEVTMDTFGMAFLAGCLLFAKRRLARPPSLGHDARDWVVLSAFFVIGVTGYLIEGLRIIHEQSHMPGFSFVGLACAWLFTAFGVDRPVASSLHLGVWWFHALLSLGIVAAFPYTRLFHSFAGALSLATNTKRLGRMTPVSIEEVEQTGRFGVGSVLDFTRQQLLELDACVVCGRCEEACPAFEAGKPLSPKAVVQDIKAHLEAVAFHANWTTGYGLRDTAGSLNSTPVARSPKPVAVPALHGGVIGDETLWSCTTCSACVDVCPLRVNPLELITDMRRHLIGEGQLRGSPAAALQKSQRSGNPWGLPQQERFDWADALDVPTPQTNKNFDVLYWVGCAASYDRRTQKVAKSVVKLLQAAKVSFAVLGPEERCTGESARRMGDEFVFQELAAGNIETLDRYQVRTILTHCPHCLNSFKNDYPQFGGDYEVVHHTEFLARLVSQGRLPLRAGAGDENSRMVTYHDPCYLARINNLTDQPRQLIQLGEARLFRKAGLLIEMPRNRRNTACCGAGGGRMWFDDPPAERVGVQRVQEALSTGAETIAVACPFCLIMMTDGVARKNADVQVQDVAEILAERL